MISVGYRAVGAGSSATATYISNWVIGEETSNEELAWTAGIGLGAGLLGKATSGIGKGVVGKVNPLEGANFAQKTYRSTFSEIGKFNGSTVESVANQLKIGTLNPSDVPIDYIVRDGNTLILNTRSAQALEQAGIPRSQWAGINRTGNGQFEDMLTGQLTRNKLDSSGTPTVRQSNTNN